MTAQYRHTNAAHLNPSLKWLEVGGLFTCSGARWKVTDIGNRTITAIKITKIIEDDPTWISGPPYAVPEISFDEYDIEGIEI